MNDSRTLEERLDQIGRELGGRPSLVPDVMAKLESGSVCPRPARHPWRNMRTVTVLATAACVIVTAVIWMLRPNTLYARALEALGNARTVHVTGWTTQIVRKWPLEHPQPAGKTEQQPVDAWYWREDDGTSRSYEKFGPVIQVRDGGSLREYQEDVNLLFVAEGMPKDNLEKFSTLAEYLRALKLKGLEKEDLGTRTEDGRTLRGLKVIRRFRTEEYWFDADTDLPMTFTRSQVEEDGTTVGFELHFAYDGSVPMAVAEYTPPETDNIRYGGNDQHVQLVWLRHVQEIGRRLEEQPIEGPVAVLPRERRQTFSLQYEMRTPDGKYQVVPLDLDQYFPLTVKNFINLRVATSEGDTAYESWRIPEELLEEEFPRSDLVYVDGTPWQEWVQYALNTIGLEYVDRVEQRKFWIAHHDGRRLKPWRMVHPPVPYIVEGGVEKKGVVRPGIGHQLSPATMYRLLMDFNCIQNHEFRADNPIIIDETGLPRPPRWDREQYPDPAQFREQVMDKFYVATDSPWFAGVESRQMARDWFKKEFGVTFTEETRPLTIHALRRKQ